MNTDNCKSWAKRDSEVIAPFARIQYYPFVMKSGSGAMVEDMDGNQFIDMLASASSQNIGHSHPKIIAAVEAQMRDYSQYTNAYFYNPRSIELAEKLTAITPGTFAKKVAFGLSGSDSIDCCIKLARRFTGRSKIICFEGAYHGSTYGALAVSNISLNMRRGLGAMLPDVYVFPFPDVENNGPGDGERCLNEIRRAFASYLPADEVAAVFLEPIQGDGGLIVPPQAFMTGLYELCRASGILFVDDEIQQGFMRTGEWFGIDNFGIAPDLIALGKSCGGGLPVSAVVGRAEIFDALGPPAHLFTMGGNAACAAAGIANIEILSEPGFKQDLARRAAKLRARLDGLMKKHKMMTSIHGLGMSLGAELGAQGGDSAAAVANKVCYRSWENGLILICVAGNVLRIQPPLVITDEQIDRACDIIDRAMTDYENGDIPDSVLETVKGW